MTNPKEKQKMKVELIIADDKELRAAINELIRGEVLNVARKDIKGIIASAVGDKLPSGGSAVQTMERLFSEEIKRQVAAILNQGKSYSEPSFLQRAAREEVRNQIREALEKGNAI
jgi:hypothetical protein